MYAVTSAEHYEGGAGIVLFDNADDLRLGESRLPHDGFLSAFGRETERFQVARITGAASVPLPRTTRRLQSL